MNNNLTEFLISCQVKNNTTDKKVKSTNTRIGGDVLRTDVPKIYSGSYYIPEEKNDTFVDLYYNEVFVKKNPEYLTESQIINNSLEGVNGPILIDLDFRYELGVTEKQYTVDHIEDIVDMYLEELKKIYAFDGDTNFNVYVMEKEKVNILEEKQTVKDGIHMIIGLQANHLVQEYLRNIMVNELSNNIDNIPLTNDWDSVLDAGITHGTTNWQLYGSRKPYHEAYSLTHIYNIKYDTDDGQIMRETIEEITMSKSLFIQLMARYTGNPRFSFTSEFENTISQLVTQHKKGLKKKSGSSSSRNKNILRIIDENDMEENENIININEINNFEKLQNAINIIFNHLSFNEYYLKELHEYTQILPEKYYKPGSYDYNIRVGFALKNTDERLFLTWIMLRSKASDFDYSDIPNQHKKWKKMNKHSKNNKILLTKKSIIYWAKNDAYEKYLVIKNKSIDFYIEKTISTPSDYDFATVLYQIHKDKYICSSFDKPTWYIFNNHKWELDKGNTLRNAISTTMYNLYINKINEINDTIIQNEDETIITNCKLKIKKITILMEKLKKSSEKSNILKESMELFYDGNFLKKLDSNPMLLGFNNGVIDFENKLFRDGEHQDYLTKSTNIDYNIHYNEPDYLEIRNEINTFMEQLFPIPSLNKYMWEHLASCLIGKIQNQTFNIYKGVGSNGKSMLTDLMTQTLGDYKGVVPLNLIVDKRGSIGSTSSEIMQLKNIRYAIMQEPSKDMKINEGIMKEITAGDPLQGRALYHESETFNPQFTLAVCTNVDFTIVSNDDGTWRRIRRVPFLAKFVDKIEKYDLNDENNKYIFKRDRTLKDKFPIWTSIFAGMLVNIAYQTEGKVEDCDIVLEESENYRKKQDNILSYVTENIIVTHSKEDTIRKRDVLEHYKAWVADNSSYKTAPNPSELLEHIDKLVGKSKNNTWKGCKIIYNDAENDSMCI